MASLKDARAVVKEGGCTNWGQLPDFTHKTDKFGLGFTTGTQKAVRHARLEDLLCISIIWELMRLKIVKKIQTLTAGSTLEPMED